MVVLGALAPHPPIIVPAVGRGRESEASSTRKAMSDLAGIAAEAAPETLVVFTPHGNVLRDGLLITGAPVLRGDLSQFGAAQEEVWTNDLELAFAIETSAGREGLPALVLREDEAKRYKARTTLDHGVLVPLSFMGEAVRRAKLVVVGMGMLPLLQLYRFGQAVARAAEETGRRVAVLASGDLSHRLAEDGPYGYHPQGPAFDRLLVDLLGRADVPGILGIDPGMAEEAGECGYRTIVMMLGSLDGLKLEARVLSYEGPFGVGYAVAVFKPSGPDPARAFGAGFERAAAEAAARRHREESPYVRLARETVEAYVRGVEPPSDGTRIPDADRRAGVFVSIKKHGELRGCIGTIAPTRRNIAEEIRANAIAASTQDPRFEPVSPGELPDLVYSVDVLGEAEPVAGLEELDPRRYGVIVRRGGRQGLLLPDLEGVDTAAEQVAIARRKAGIGPDEAVELLRFEVVRHH
ncbi:MAG: AmmeMemoRadiSam system protein A [Patescibacteria group bacterium]